MNYFSKQLAPTTKIFLWAQIKDLGGSSKYRYFKNEPKRLEREQLFGILKEWRSVVSTACCDFVGNLLHNYCVRRSTPRRCRVLYCQPIRINTDARRKLLVWEHEISDWLSLEFSASMNGLFLPLNQITYKAQEGASCVRKWREIWNWGLALHSSTIIVHHHAPIHTAPRTHRKRVAQRDAEASFLPTLGHTVAIATFYLL